MITGESPLFGMGSLNSLGRVLGHPHEELLRLADAAGDYYRPTARRALKGQGKWRKIDDPAPELKELQKKIKDRLFGRIQFPPTMRGGIKGRGALSTARMHTRKPEVLKIDLKNCFPRTTHKKVYRQLIRLFGCAPDVGRLITMLTTFQRMVPQGAPTSSVIVNLVLLSLHDELALYCKEHGWTFSMWVDDIVISGSNLRNGIDDLIYIIHKHGYTVRLEKIQIMRDGKKAQEVLGYNVNHKASVSRSRIESIGKEILSFKGQASIPMYRRNSLLGKINYVASAPSQKHRAEKLKKLAEAVLPPMTSDGKKPDTGERIRIKYPRQFWPRKRRSKTSMPKTT